MRENPTMDINVAFMQYLNKRTREQSAHLVKGIPDYAFSMDQILLQKLRAMTPVRIFFEAYTKWLVPFMKKMFQMDCVAVSPRQFPEIFSMGEECARRLGIGVPQIFVKYSPIINAFTYATDNTSPVIVIHSALIEYYSVEEQLAIVGHECGHIHNNHGIYHLAAEMITQLTMKGGAALFPGLQQIIAILSLGAKIFLMRWSRCGEVTCDRAGLICSPSLNAMMMALAKLGSGGIDKLTNVNFDEYIKQMEQFQSTNLRFMEYFRTHPLVPKRLEAARLFNDCDILYNWRPDLKRPGLITTSKKEIDQKCEKFIS